MHRHLHDILKSGLAISKYLSLTKDAQKNGSYVTELVANGTTPLRLEEFLPYRLSVLSSAVSRVLLQLYARHGLSMNEWVVLMSLGEFGELTAKALGAKNHMHKTKVSRVVATLLERGWISRRPNHTDLRESFLHLTPLGKTLYEECTPLAADLVRRLDEAIPAADREVLERCLVKLAATSQQIMTGRRAGSAGHPW